MATNIAIVDYHMGNIHSIVKKLNRVGVNPTVSSTPKDILQADKILLPGVGHFSQAMHNLQELGLIDILNEAVLIKKKPTLGICLGMQLMTKFSEEGFTKGLGWFDANVLKFNTVDKKRYKVPHIGWSGVNIKKHSPLMDNIEDNSEFYFVHSYYCKCINDSDILNSSLYELEFASAIEKENIFGVQYHPEKSHDIGETLLNNFVRI